MPLRVLMGLAIGLAALAVATVVVLVGPIGWTNDDLDELAVSDQESPAHAADSAYLVLFGDSAGYRLVSSNLATGDEMAVHAFGPGTAAYDVTVNADRSTLALSYTANTANRGSGVYLIDLTQDDGRRQPMPLAPEQPGVFHDDLHFSPDGRTLWATMSSEASNSVVALSVETGEVMLEIESAVSPVTLDDGIAYLRVAADGSRRALVFADERNEKQTEITVLDGRYDLGHLLADRARNRLLFTALVPPGGSGIRLGEPAGAHGAHDGPSQWLVYDIDRGEVGRLLEHEPLGVRDASLLSDGTVLAATTAGLARIGDSIDLSAEGGRVVVLVAG